MNPSENIRLVQFFESETSLYRQTISGWEILTSRGKWGPSEGPGADMALADDEFAWLHARTTVESDDAALQLLGWERPPYIRPTRLAPAAEVAEVRQEVEEWLANTNLASADGDLDQVLWDEVERRLAARGYTGPSG